MYYDPLIAKLVVWGSTREESIQRTLRALNEFKVTGVKNNVRFLERIALADDFVKGNYNTHFIEDNFDFLMGGKEQNMQDDDVVSIAAFVEYLDRIGELKPKYEPATALNSWQKLKRARSARNARF